jgi:hypothetical protein
LTLEIGGNEPGNWRVSASNHEVLNRDRWDMYGNRLYVHGIDADKSFPS